MLTGAGPGLRENAIRGKLGPEYRLGTAMTDGAEVPVLTALIWQFRLAGSTGQS